MLRGLQPVARIVVALLMAAIGLAPSRAAHADATHVKPIPRKLSVVLPDADNLQYLAFWVALGGGFFTREDLEVDLQVSRMAVVVDELVRREGFEVGVLPPPVYLELITDQVPIVLVANLLANDGIDLIVRREVAASRGIGPQTPLRDRLLALRGARIGIAPGPVPRMQAVFKSVGLVAEEVIERVVLPGPDQNDALTKGKVDGLFAHTPYLERALADQDAVMVVNVSGGEVPELAGRQIHAVVMARTLVDKEPERVYAFVRAVLAAQRLIHQDPKRTADAVLAALPSLDRRLVETLLPIYAPAVPTDPRVSTEGLFQAAALFPARRKAPDLTGKDLHLYVDRRFAESAFANAPAPDAPTARSIPTRWATRLGAAALGLAALAWVALWVRRRRAARTADPTLPAA